MGSKSRPVGRPRKNTRRVEVRLNADDPLTVRLEEEAAARHVTLQQHILDILVARFMALSVSQQQEPEQQAAQDGTAAAMADIWLT